VYLGLGRAELDRNEMFSRNHGVAIAMSLDAGDRAGPPLPPLHGVLPGKMMLQNLPSVLVGHALDPKPNDVILDMCSAPGGKTSHLASLVRNKATIVACDKRAKKVVAEKELFRRMGASCITPLVLDATSCCFEEEDGEEERHNRKHNKSDDEEGEGLPPGQQMKDVQHLLQDAPVGEGGLKQVKGFYEKSFDKIVLDPPCSALGLRPKLFVVQETRRQMEKHVEYQKKFVSQAVRLLKEGGHMIYSTCTINGHENEGMVSHVLQNYPCMELLPIELPPSWRRDDVVFPGSEGFGLSLEERNRVCRFDPSGAGDTMGIFCCIVSKKTTLLELNR